jgi:hypothetical protein
MDLEQLLRETLAEKQALAQKGEPLEPSRPPQPKKRQVLEKFLGAGVLQVQVDTTLPGVDVPDVLVGQPMVAFNFSYRFQATPDLILTDEELAQTLSFKGVDYRVRLPLRAVLAARSVKTGEPAEFQVFTGEDYQDPPPPETA